jgi:hypothetical protein
MIDWLSVLKPYERHLAATGMLGGFGFDYAAYGRLDHAVTQTVLIIYLSVAAGSILLLHYLEGLAVTEGFLAKLRRWLPVVTQFAFGTLWSAFLVFYARSGVFAASWPFLLLLLAIFVGNEVFKVYHSRLIFSTVLFAFALLSYAIFMLPVFTHTIGKWTFLGSTAAAAIVFVLFLRLLNWVGHSRLGRLRWQIGLSALGVFMAVNVLYFLDVLPPLPLSLQRAGVFHQIKKMGAVYYAMGEPQTWLEYVGIPPVMHVTDKQPVFVYSAVFAPIDLKTNVLHVWQRYNAGKGKWVTKHRIPLFIAGSRERQNGYRTFSKCTGLEAGLWRVDIDAVDGRLIGRTEFTVEDAPYTGANVTTVMN